MSDERPHEVRYLDVNIATFNELQSHNDAVVRDMVLAAGAREGSPHANIEALGPSSRFMGEKRQELRAQADRALEEQRSVADLVVSYTEAQGRIALHWLQLLEDADELTRRGELLVPLPSPEVVHMRRWLTDQLRLQVFDGRPPARYVGLERHASR